MSDVFLLTPEDTPLPPDPSVTPDLALQFVQCADDARPTITALLQNILGPDADIRGGCINGEEKIAGWSDQPEDQAASQARDAVAAGLDLLDGFLTGFFIGRRFIENSGQAEWDSRPHVYNSDGQPDPNGSTHVDGFQVNLVPPNQVETVLTGSAQIIATTSDFTLTLTDALTTDGNVILVATQKSLDVDLKELAALTFFVPFLHLGFGLEAGLAWGAGPPSGLTIGVGGAVAGLLPHVVLLPPGPMGSKVTFNYGSVEVQPEGIAARATAVFSERSPAVQLSGPASMSIPLHPGHPHGPFPYTATPSDLRDPVSFAWTLDGKALPNNSSAVSLAFPVTGKKPNTWMYHEISVNAIDVDGFSATATISVSVYVAENETPPPQPRRPLRPLAP